MQVLLPEGWKPPIGYSNGIAVDAGRIVFVAGQVGWNAEQVFESDHLPPQFEQALRNIVACSPLAGARPEHICRMTAYCCDKPAYLASRARSWASGAS
jgi:enamine deaminase RidA (YjgF/YER057c/UK114 family)